MGSKFQLGSWGKEVRTEEVWGGKGSETPSRSPRVGSKTQRKVEDRTSQRNTPEIHTFVVGRAPKVKKNMKEE